MSHACLSACLMLALCTTPHYAGPLLSLLPPAGVAGCNVTFGLPAPLPLCPSLMSLLTPTHHCSCCHQVWPGVTYFPDFLNPATQPWWTAQFRRFKEQLLNYDGIWIDMNEWVPQNHASICMTNDRCWSGIMHDVFNDNGVVGGIAVCVVRPVANSVCHARPFLQ